MGRIRHPNAYCARVKGKGDNVLLPLGGLPLSHYNREELFFYVLVLRRELNCCGCQKPYTYWNSACRAFLPGEEAVAFLCVACCSCAVLVLCSPRVCRGLKTPWARGITFLALQCYPDPIQTTLCHKCRCCPHGHCPPAGPCRYHSCTLVVSWDCHKGGGSVDRFSEPHLKPAVCHEGVSNSALLVRACARALEVRISPCPLEVLLAGIGACAGGLVCCACVEPINIAA